MVIMIKMTTTIIIIRTCIYAPLITTKLRNMDYTNLYEVQLKPGKVCIA